MLDFIKRLFGEKESKAEYKEQGPRKIFLKCVNCELKFEADTSEVHDIECPHCGYTRGVTWRELGIDADELRPLRPPTDPALRDVPDPIKNPNPQKVKFGILREPVEKITRIKEATLLNGGKELEELFAECRDVELGMYQVGASAASGHPYKRIAIIARKNKDYPLEIAICERLIELYKESGYPADDKTMQRLKKARLLLQKEEESKTIDTEKSEKAKKSATPEKSTRTTILEKQCSELGIPFEEIEIRWDAPKKQWHPIDGVLCKKVEQAVLCLMGQNGFRGTFYELHPLMQIMQAGCLDYLEESASRRFLENPYTRTFNVQVWMYELDKGKTASLIKGASRQELLTNWKRINQDERVRVWFPNISEDDLTAVLDGLGDTLFHKILDFLLADPKNHNSGWPDIFAYDGNNLKLVEVKTTDKIRDAQAERWNKFIKPNGFDMKIVRVLKANM